MTNKLPTRNRLSRFALIVILFCFAGLAAARLNELYFFTPDSADYVLMARGLIDHLAYEQIDSPGTPPFTLRPPGMSLLLIPAALIAPYQAILAKVTVVLFALLLLILFYECLCKLDDAALASSAEGSPPARWPALCIVLLLATNPYFLLFSTLVMSEVPFMALSLGILYLLASETEQNQKRNLVLLTCLFLFLPLLRTIGIALTLALGIWAITSRQRWRYLIPVAGSLVTLGLWILRNSSLQSDLYSSLVLGNMKSAGLVGTLLSMVNRCLTHFQSLCETLIPNMPGAVPAYERFLLEGLNFLPGPPLVYSVASLLVLAISLYGMLQCRERGGMVCLLYIVITFGILSVWPWMQPRFVLPLLPVILAFLPVGLRSLILRLAGTSVATRRVIVSLALIPVLVMLGIQTQTDVQLVSTNLQLIRNGETFYQTQYPSSHFSNFVAAGNWIREQTPPDARLLTRRNDIATTAQRFQRLVYFEKTPPAQLHELIQSFGPQYLVSFDKNTIDAFPWHLLNDDLIYRLTPVYDKEGVTILKVEPNYEGTIRDQYWQENAGLTLARTILEKFPHRLSAQVAYLRQLLEAEQYEKAISFVEQLGTVQDVHLTNFLGWAYAGNRQFQQALDEFVKASRMPGQVAIRGSIQRGIKLCQQQLASKDDDQSPPAETPQRNLQIAQAFWKLTYYRKAQRYAQKVVAAEKATPDIRDQAHLILAHFALITGQPEQAAEELKQIQNKQTPEVQRVTERLRLEKYLYEVFELDLHDDPNKIDVISRKNRIAVLELVSLYEKEGIPGKALPLLKKAHLRAPFNQQILKRLAELQLFYHLLPEAEASYLILKQFSPDDPDVDAALKKIADLKQVPQF